MWQIYSLLWLFTNAIENSIDKMAVIRSEQLDPIVMTFYRVTIYVVIIALIGFSWLDGEMYWLPDWKIIVFGIFSTVLSLSYTYALGKIEVTSIATIAYLGPVGYLLIDTMFLEINLSWFQILGILLLVLGGIGFSIEWKTKKLKEEISPKILGVFLFWIAYGGIEWYLFKFMHSEQGVNATTFFANSWTWTVIVLLFLVLIKGKTRELFSRSAKSYAVRSIASKSCDVGTTLFAAQALTLATVSQVSAMSALEPLVLLVVTVIIQQVLKIHLNERLDRSNALWKVCMVILLLAWGFLAH